MAKKFWIGTSWKMNKTLAEAMLFAEQLAQQQDNRNDIQRFVIPPFTAVRQVKDALQSTDIKVGAQNMHWSDEGAWTGEISPRMLTDCNLDLVEIGHSERRTHFGETDETVSRKVAAAVKHKLTPLICIGETKYQHDSGSTLTILETQLASAFSSLPSDAFNADMLVAYEPVWAIGEGGIPASAFYANDVHKNIAQTTKKILGRTLPCLYGGSVNTDNCRELAAMEHVDGLFIGRSAWNVGGYQKIIDLCSLQ